MWISTLPMLIWQGREQGASLEDNGKVWMTTKVHYHCSPPTWWHDGQSSGWWELVWTIPGINGVKQGCVLAPMLFGLMFSAMLTDAFADTDIGIGIRYRMDGSIFNLRRLKAKTKVKTNTINDFLFADDCALNSISEDDRHQNVYKFAEACTNFGLTISIKKTEVMHQPAPGKIYIEPSITINGQCLKAVDKFTYLGSTISRNVVIDDELDARLAKANSAFSIQLKCMEPMWHHTRDQNQGIPCYCDDHAPVAYGSETWQFTDAMQQNWTTSTSHTSGSYSGKNDKTKSLTQRSWPMLDSLASTPF